MVLKAGKEVEWTKETRTKAGIVTKDLKSGYLSVCSVLLAGFCYGYTYILAICTRSNIVNKLQKVVFDFVV